MVRLRLILLQCGKRAGESIPFPNRLAPAASQDNMLGSRQGSEHGIGQIRSGGESVLPFGLGEREAASCALTGGTARNAAAQRRASVAAGDDYLGRSSDPIHRSANR